MGFCGKRCGWLSAFLLLQVLAFTACLLAVVSPSWQFVYLEDGRTEHHHGLWLDCKRDYSNDYGRPREYYESLYRLDHLQGPFDQFALPQLMCVYKFDYWMDEEDLYEHGYDENRLQDDAYQHLFLGWKIAALTALLFGLVCSLSAIMILFCAFCHRLLICVASVLVALGVVTYSTGNVIFYMYANYQDNNILKEEDGIYEQHFGWSFYTSLVGNALLLVSAVIGCLSTSAVVSFRKAKLVKIEVQEDDNNQLLSSIGSSSNERIAPFKRAYSAVYKIDSSELRKWEREAMRRNDFKRANSMPNIKKGIMRSTSTMAHSNSDISKAITEPPQRIADAGYEVNIFTTGGATSRPSALRPNVRVPDDVIYEYVDPSSISLSSTRMNTLDASQHAPFELTGHLYDPVASESATSSMREFGEDEYLRPRNHIHRQPKQSTLIETTSRLITEFKTTQGTRGKDSSTTPYEAVAQHRRGPSTNFDAEKPSTSHALESRLTTFSPTPPRVPPKPPTRSSLLKLQLPKEPVLRSVAEDVVQINTFAADGSGMDPGGRIARSITNLTAIGSDRASAVSGIFQQSESTELSSNDGSFLNGPSSFAHNTSLSGLKETSFDTSSLRFGRYVPSEMDRSIGSSATFRPTTPAAYDYDDDQSTISVSGSSTRGLISVRPSRTTQPTAGRHDTMV